MNILHYWLQKVILPLVLVWTIPGYADSPLVIENAWIRIPVPGASMLAGYATLRNTGDTPLLVRAVQCSSFRSVSIHETVIEAGVAKMRALPQLEIAPQSSVELAPGGKHLMLMQPIHEISSSSKAEIVFLLADGTQISTLFTVRGEESAAAH